MRPPSAAALSASVTRRVEAAASTDRDHGPYHHPSVIRDPDAAAAMAELNVDVSRLPEDVREKLAELELELSEGKPTASSTLDVSGTPEGRRSIAPPPPPPPPHLGGTLDRLCFHAVRV